MTLYLLWASQGEYSDRREWPIAAYENEADCSAAVLRASALCRALAVDRYRDSDAMKALRENEQFKELCAILGNDDLWFGEELTLTCCELELRAASGTEARSGETEGLDPKGDGPASEAGDAQL